MKPGPNLFGETPDGDARLILDGLTQRFQRDEAFPSEADLADLADLPKSPDPARLDVLTPAGGGGGPDVQPGGVGQADSHSQGGDGGHERPGSPGPETAPAGNAALTNVGAGDLWRLTADELKQLEAEVGLSDHAKLVQAFGSEEVARDFERLDRARNSMDPRRSGPANEEFNTKFGDLTAEQDRLVYGIGETTAQVDGIREVLLAHSDLAGAGPGEGDWISYVAALGVRRATVDELRLVPEGRASSQVQAAYVRLQGAYAAFVEHGVDPNTIPARMAAALVERGGWRPDQASEFIGAFVKDMVAGAKPAEHAAEARPAIGGPQAALPAPAAAQALQRALEADPELKAALEDTEAAAAQLGLKPAEGPDDPATLAEAIRAAAVCLRLEE